MALIDPAAFFVLDARADRIAVGYFGHFCGLELKRNVFACARSSS